VSVDFAACNAFFFFSISSLRALCRKSMVTEQILIAQQAVEKRKVRDVTSKISPFETFESELGSSCRRLNSGFGWI
jgi:hypothetical protein